MAEIICFIFKRADGSSVSVGMFGREQAIAYGREMGLVVIAQRLQVLGEEVDSDFTGADMEAISVSGQDPITALAESGIDLGQLEKAS